MLRKNNILCIQKLTFHEESSPSRCRWWICLLVILTFIALMGAGMYVAYHFLKVPKDTLNIIEKEEWKALPPNGDLKPLDHPVPYVIILHTGTGSCDSQKSCSTTVRQIQNHHIKNNKWTDIGSSFYVGGDGNVYVGRGWDGVGAFAYGYNNKSIGISFIGTFITQVPTTEQMTAGKQLIDAGVRLGKIAKDYKLLAHRQVSATESPGQLFFDEIKKWDHWTQNP